MTTDQRIARRKLSPLEPAQDLGNVSKACKIVGHSRQRCHEIRRNHQTCGAAGLVDEAKGPKAPHPDRRAAAIEQATLDHAGEHPAHGPDRAGGPGAGAPRPPGRRRRDPRRLEPPRAARAATSCWSRHELPTKPERLLRLERATAARAVELTAARAELLERFSPELRDRRIEAPPTGASALVAVDSFFVGVLKGLGKVYPRTAIDRHSRHAWGARLYTNEMPPLNSPPSRRSLNDEVLPTFEEHGAKIDAVLSDNGREFRGRPDRHPYEPFPRLEAIGRARDDPHRPAAEQRDRRAPAPPPAR